MKCNALVGLVVTIILISYSCALKLNSEASWIEAIGNYFHPQHLIGGSSEQKQAAERTLDGITLEEEADWTTSWEKNLSNQSLYNNMVKEIFNALTRIIGWTAMSLALYGFTFNSRSRSFQSRPEEEYLQYLERNLI